MTSISDQRLRPVDSVAKKKAIAGSAEEYMEKHGAPWRGMFNEWLVEAQKAILFCNRSWILNDEAAQANVKCLCIEGFSGSRDGNF